MKWRGRLGWVLLGPTEHRVAGYLDAATRYGRVALPSPTLAALLGLSRSEFYRITRRLQSLGLFGIEDDQGGTRGGRRYWRQGRPVAAGSSALDPAKHRLAWARIAAWCKAKAARLLARLRPNQTPRAQPTRPRLAERPSGDPAPVSWPAGAGPPTFAEVMRRLAPALAADWRL